MTTPTVDDLIARDYAVALWRRDGQFVLEIEDLSLAVTGATLDEAWGLLEARKREYFETMTAIGRASAVPRPASEAPGFWRASLPFVFKTAFAALLFAAVGLSILPAVRIQLTELRHEARQVARNVPIGLIQGFETYDKLTPQRQQKFLEGIRRFGRSIGPAIKELGKALDEERDRQSDDPANSAPPNR
jgi:hypothetical protein